MTITASARVAPKRPRTRQTIQTGRIRPDLLRTAQACTYPAPVFADMKPHPFRNNLSLREALAMEGQFYHYRGTGRSDPRLDAQWLADQRKQQADQLTA